ncbi:MAG TPA: hypothetical protein VGM74_06275 [Burkholderiaceae bacterium]|jgi:hypothetical protein
MPYIQRDAQGAIESLHRSSPSPHDHEFLPDGHPELQAFMGGGHAVPEFGQLDADFVRVIEDVIDTLIVKHVINITDLPEQAQAKLFARKSFRERVSRSSLQLFQSTDYGDVI